VSDNLPLSATRFRIEIDALQDSGAFEVVFPEARILARKRNRAAMVQYGPLILRRALSASQEWYEWWDAARQSRRQVNRTVTVLLLDASDTPSARWVFARSKPVAYHLSNLNAMNHQMLIENLEIAVGGFVLD
jgi:phage tail-like protein